MDKGIFVGSSHFQGLGLEIELSERFQSVDWLNQNGVDGLHEIIESDENLQKENRWSYLLSQKLNIEEVNVAQHHEFGSGSDVQFFNNLFNERFSLENVKYIFLELNSISRFPFYDTMITPIELENMLKHKTIDPNLKNRIEEWLYKSEKGITYQYFKENLERAIAQFPKIKFYVCDWYNLSRDKIEKDFPNNILYYTHKGKKYISILDGSRENKQLISDVSFCYKHNKITWEVSYLDAHTNKEGQKYLSEIFFKQIKQELL